MSEQLVKSYRENQAIQIAAFSKKVTNPFLFKLFLLAKLPMAFIAGLKVKQLNENECSISVPYKWLNQNPFRSTYFAVLAMAAEMSSGMIAMLYTINAKPSIAMLVTNIEAQFVKKATGITTFSCPYGEDIKAAIEKAILTGEGQTIICESVGKSENGEIEAVFKVQWSFKARLK